MNKELSGVSDIFWNARAEKPLDIRPLAGKGFVNQVWLVETAREKFIVRLNGECSRAEYEKEKWAAARAQEKGIPTPPILSVGVFEYRAFSIQKHVEGVEGRNCNGDKRFIWKTLGEYAKSIHAIETGGFGLGFRDRETYDPAGGWREYLAYNLESLNERDELLKLGVITTKQSKTARRIFEELGDKEFRFGLNHGDLSLKNSMIDRTGTIHLIDWGSCESSIVPHHELIQLLLVQRQENSPDEAEFAAFLDGYGIGRDEFAEMLPDLRALSLLRAFDKLRWALDRQISNLKDYVLTAKMTAEEYL